MFALAKGGIMIQEMHIDFFGVVFVYRMYTNTDILKRRVLHGNVTFVWLRWPDWVTVRGGNLLRELAGR